MGELLAEIMRPRVGMTLSEIGDFTGPFPSGAPGNFIDTVVKLGHKGGIISGVGDDDFGRCITDRLERDGVDCRYVLKSGNNSTAVAFVTYFDDGSRKFIFHIGNTPVAEARAPDMAGIGEVNYFHMMGCSLMAAPSLYSEMIKAMRGFAAKGAKISFDPNIRPELLKGRPLESIIGPVMELCNVLMPGVEELKLISGCETVESGVKKLFENPALEYIALKRGGDGCTIYTGADDKGFDFGIYKVEVRDPTGAGDSFDAGFLCGLCEGLSIEETVKMATAAAALNTAAFGPMEGDISRETVRAMIDRG